jgi:hypothetical protein
MKMINLIIIRLNILLLNPWIWWLIFTVSFLSQITIVYADELINFDFQLTNNEYVI